MTTLIMDERMEFWLQFAQTLRLVSIDPSRDRARVYIFTWQPTLWGEFALIRRRPRHDIGALPQSR